MECTIQIQKTASFVCREWNVNGKEWNGMEWNEWNRMNDVHTYMQGKGLLCYRLSPLVCWKRTAGSKAMYVVVVGNVVKQCIKVDDDDNDDGRAKWMRRQEKKFYGRETNQNYILNTFMSDTCYYVRACTMTQSAGERRGNMI